MLTLIEGCWVEVLASPSVRLFSYTQTPTAAFERGCSAYLSNNTFFEEPDGYELEILFSEL
jgi:hypothetical protein